MGLTLYGFFERAYCVPREGCKNEGDLLLRFTNKTPKEAQDLIAKLLKFKHTERLSISNAVQHPFFKGIENFRDPVNIRELAKLK
jgi:serine/threonine protein kinase